MCVSLSCSSGAVVWLMGLVVVVYVCGKSGV